MAVSSKPFPPRKRWPPATSFLSPKIPPGDLIPALRSLAADISFLHPSPPTVLPGRRAASLICKCSLLSLLFDEMPRIPSHDRLRLLSNSSVILCLEEMYVLFQRIATLIEDCSSDNNGSKMWLLIQGESFAQFFHDLNSDLLTLLEILHGKELTLSEDIEELKNFVIKQCREDKESFLDPSDSDMGIDVLHMLASIKRGIAPDHSKLAQIFSELGLSDSASCREEIELLEDEAQCQGGDEKSRSDIIELIGLVRYAKCVLYGASRSAKSDALLRRRKTASEANVPSDLRCPITLELMRDPVVAATGQTYDRSSIAAWIESGHNTCPKSGQVLAHTNLIPNRALKNLIAMWCRDQWISYPESSAVVVESNGGRGGAHGRGGTLNRAALEATKMTVSFLVNKLSLLSADFSSCSPPNSLPSSSSCDPSQSTDAVDQVVYELRALAKTDSDSRAIIGESGAIPLLVRHLGSEDPSLQVNAVTTLLNLSILDENKAKMMATDGAVDGVIEVLRSATTWEAKGNAAATLFSLAGVSAYCKRLGKKTRVITGLLDLVRDGSTGAKRDALVAIVSLAGDKEAVGKMLEGGGVEAVAMAMEELPEETTTVLEMVVRRGGVMAVAGIAGTKGLIGRITAMLREGSGRARESAAATLVTVCRRGGAEMVEEVATAEGVEAAVWDLMGNGTARAKRKAGSLMRFLQQWAAGLVDAENNANANADANASANANVADGWLERYPLTVSLS